MDVLPAVLPPEDTPKDAPGDATGGWQPPAAARDRIADIIQHSEPVVQILGVPPHKLARWGSSAMTVVVGLLAALAWLIHYPDVVPAGVIITTPVPPATVVAQASGHLETLAVHDGDQVRDGAVLARIHTSADPDAVARLEAVLAGWHDDHIPSDAAIAALAAQPLGELQADYAALARAHDAYSWHLAADPAAAQIRVLAIQRGPLQDRIDSLDRQRVLLTREESIAERGYGRTMQLAMHQDASVLTLDERERVMLAAKRGLETLAVDQANTRLDLDHVEQAITDLGVADRQRRQDLRVALREAVKMLSGRLALWERTYVLRAPIAGTVSLSHFSTDSQFVRVGEDVMAIVPAEAQVPVGRIRLPISRAGSVKVGQTVFVRLDNYPGERFGLLKGRVAAIAPVPLAAHYAVSMALPDGLMTTFGQHLTYQQEMEGQAEIVVEDLRVIDRIFYQFRQLFHHAQTPPPMVPVSKPN